MKKFIVMFINSMTDRPLIRGILLSTIVGLVAIIGGLFFYYIAIDQVIVLVDGETLVCKTLKNRVQAVINERGIQLAEGDVVRPALEAKVSENLQIEVVRAFPVTIKTAAETVEVKTVERPVAEVLDWAQLVVNEEDRVVPARDQLVKPGTEIRVYKVTTKTITTKVELKAATEYRRDKELEKGKSVVLQKAKNGLAERQIKVVYEDGREKKRVVIDEKVIEPKINAIVALGIRPVIRTLQTSRGTYRYTEVKTMVATAYSPGPESCGVYAKYGRTYTGKKAGFGLVAVDPKVIPLKTKLYIEGYGWAEAADIGGAIKGDRIDLCYETYREAVMFGRKKVKVYILID